MGKPKLCLALAHSDLEVGVKRESFLRCSSRHTTVSSSHSLPSLAVAMPASCTSSEILSQLRCSRDQRRKLAQAPRGSAQRSYPHCDSFRRSGYGRSDHVQCGEQRAPSCACGLTREDIGMFAAKMHFRKCIRCENAFFEANLFSQFDTFSVCNSLQILEGWFSVVSRWSFPKIYTFCGVVHVLQDIALLFRSNIKS